MKIRFRTHFTIAANAFIAATLLAGCGVVGLAEGLVGEQVKLGHGRVFAHFAVRESKKQTVR